MSAGQCSRAREQFRAVEGDEREELLLKHGIRQWVDRGQKNVGRANGSWRMQCRLCSKELDGATNHLIQPSDGARCKYVNREILYAIYKAQGKSKILQKLLSRLDGHMRELGYPSSTPTGTGLEDEQEDIHSLDDSLAQVQGRLQQLEQRPVAAPDASSSNTSNRLEALEMDVGSLKDGVQLQQTATQQMQQRICTTANTSSSEPRETAPMFDGQEIFCNSMKTDPIPWFRKFELTLQLHIIKEHKHHAYLYSRSGGACQAWLYNLLSKYGVVANDLHTKISWDDLKAAWHKRFQVEPPEIKAMDKLMVFKQGTLTSTDWIAKYQRLTSIPYIQMGFKAIRHYFISRSCPTLSNALTHVEDTLTTTAELFDKAAQIIITNKEAKNLRLQGQTGKLSPAESDSTTRSTPPEPVSSQVTGLHSEAHAEVDSPPLLLSFEDYDARLVPTLGTQAQGKDVCAVSSPSDAATYCLQVVLHGIRRASSSSSPYGAPVLFVRKKNKDLRLCINYRKLNAQTIKNVGPLPRINDLLERLGGAKYFFKLDFKSGYHQISIRLNDRYKSAFKTRYGHFEWVVMPFGLTNAPTTFQAAMTNEFRAMLDRFVLVYLDDILVYSRSLEDHLGHLRRVLETLRRAKYKANRDKCEFVRQELEYLGHFVTPEGISPLSDKIQAIQEWPEPRNVTDAHSFLGLAGYYQRFIKGYSKIAAHLTKLQCEDRPFDFGEEAQESFLALKVALLSAEVLRIYDPLLPTRVTTDASGYGIGAVLGQHDGVDWHPIEYFNKKVSVVHSIDDARKKELLVFVHALKRWRHFLLGRSQFRWVTDNNPLVFYKTQDTVNSTTARWMAFIDQVDFFPDHIPGKSNRFADALSRRPDHCMRSTQPSRPTMTCGTASSAATKPTPSFATSTRIAPLLIRRLLTTGSKRGTYFSTRGERTFFAYLVILTCVHGFLASSTMLPPTNTLESIARLADFASDFGGPAFSTTSRAIASHARFVDTENVATIVCTASYDHYRYH
ncbi:hypothetical protein CBR_g32129 [Chara braunii]|uniref:Reverse transcriptase domain-containing protein n=1 Tax=Chara braunii TaxID=69332 RepID=A0A388JMV4_CHABU|nr:hypothetical protein CBR_g32129 [Chara braunii]|eukprot:GBG59111.1 hypothetical protein CBR_g32129 [Chara braunii]